MQHRLSDHEKTLQNDHPAAICHQTDQCLAKPPNTLECISHCAGATLRQKLKRASAMQPVVTQTEEQPIMGGESSEIIIPGKDKNDADDFLMPKFGVLTEFNSTLSNLM